ncbi:hypothetical protein WK13_34470 [Burkholderia ubonensis]|nr:hypothetical protein WK13_34470 [Burkholderia ubonensis]
MLENHNKPLNKDQQNMSRLKELEEQLNRLQAEYEAEKGKAAQSAIQTCKELIAEFDLSPFDLGFVKTQLVPAKKVKKSEATFQPQKPKSVHPPKYRNPETGQTWSGLGRQPHWIEGNRDDYLIETQDSREKAARKGKAA